jgi:hypothetical protein
MSTFIHRNMNIRTWGALLVLTVAAACEDQPTAPAVEKSAAAELAYPDGSRMSQRGPETFGMSQSTPDGSQLSAEAPPIEVGPRAKINGSSSADGVPGWTRDARVFDRLIASDAQIPPPPGLVMRLLWQNTTTGDRSLWYLNGPTWDGSSYALLPTVATAWSIAATGDFNSDGHSDIVWQNTSTGDRSIWYMNNATWTGSYAVLPSVSPVWSIVGAGDFNSDGKPDLVWENTSTGDRSIWYMNGPTWGGSYALLPNVNPSWRIAGVANFNGDGTPDLVWQNLSSGQRSIWYMSGGAWSGTFSILPTISPDWRIAGAADFDGDNQSDLVWQNIVSGQRSIWLMSGGTWGGSYSLLPTVSTAWSIAGPLFPPANAVSRLSLSPMPAIVDIGSTMPTAVTAYDNNSSVVGTPSLTYTSRNPAIATVSASGVLTGVALGQTTLVAAVTGNPAIADSVIVVVTAVGGPALYSDISKWTFAGFSNLVFKVYLDMRGSGKTLGSTKVQVQWTTRALSFSGWSASGVSVSPEINLSNAGIGIIVFDMANGTGIAGKVELLQINFQKLGIDGAFNLTQSETNAGDLTVMTSLTSGISYSIGTI